MCFSVYSEHNEVHALQSPAPWSVHVSSHMDTTKMEEQRGETGCKEAVVMREALGHPPADHQGGNTPARPRRRRSSLITPPLRSLTG